MKRKTSAGEKAKKPAKRRQSKKQTEKQVAKKPTTKRKTKKKAGVAEDGFMYLSGELFWKFRAVDAEYRNAALAHNVKNNEVMQILMKTPGLIPLIGERDRLRKIMEECLKELNVVNREIESSLNVDLKDCSIDDKTGKIFFHKEENKAEKEEKKE